MIKTQPNADRSEGVSKNRKELEKELIDRELQFELEEEKKLDKIKVLSVSKLFAHAIKNIYSDQKMSDLFKDN